jgi:hypothetical protein
MTTKYRVTAVLPDNTEVVVLKGSTRPYVASVAIKRVADTEWGVITNHLTFAAAHKQARTLRGHWPDAEIEVVPATPTAVHTGGNR